MFELKFTIICCLIVTVYSSKKTWIPTTNYDDASNWVNYSKPCENDNIIFPINLEATVDLPGRQIFLKSLILPVNGELVLPQDGSLMFTEKASPKSCRGHDAYFKSMKLEGWLNPYNWKHENGLNKAIPHMERIPCIYDDVIFKNNSTFFVQLPEYPVKINSIIINGKNLTDDQFKEFLRSELGIRQFINQYNLYRVEEITIQRSNCDDFKTGCKCHSLTKQEYGTLEKNVCYYAKKKCRIPHCLDPVQPIGHCCHICGSFFVLEYNKNFDINKIRNVIESTIAESSSELIYYINKIKYHGENRIQIIIREKNEYMEYSTELGTMLKQKLQDKSLGLSVIQLSMSGLPFQPGESSNSVKVIFGSLFMVVITMTIICLIYYPVKSIRMNVATLPSISALRPFLFARFENAQDGDNNLEFRNRSVASSLFNLDCAFDNPLYGNETAGTSNQNSNEKDTEQLPEVLPQKTVFSELMKTDVKDAEE